MQTKNVVAAVILKDGKLFATQRGYGNYKDWWEFPGGKIEPGETPQEALRREIREELDTIVSVGSCYIPWNTTIPSFIFPCNVIYVPLCRASSPCWSTKLPVGSAKTNC